MAGTNFIYRLFGGRTPATTPYFSRSKLGTRFSGCIYRRIFFFSIYNFFFFLLVLKLS